jgi:GR25 family glycosyltransferase involved in LPS biosynthesis
MIDIFVINLIECINRKNQIIQDFSLYKDIQLHFIEAIRNNNGAIGCFLSFKKCVKMAKDKNMKYIIILEDDCLPMNNFEIRLKKLLNYLELNDDWDIFLGGVKKCNKIYEKKQMSDEYIYNINRAHSAHLFICNNTFYDTFLEVDETKYAVDTFWHKKYKVYILLPFLAYQRNGISNIGKIYYGNLINDYINTEKCLFNYIEKNNL